MGGWIRRLGDDLEEQRDLGSRRRVPLLGCPVHRRQLSILRGFVSSCGPTAPTPSRGMNASHKGTQTRRREAEGRLRFDCFFNRLSRRLGSADYTDGRRLVPGGSMAESAYIGLSCRSIQCSRYSRLGVSNPKRPRIAQSAQNPRPHARCISSGIGD